MYMYLYMYIVIYVYVYTNIHTQAHYNLFKHQAGGHGPRPRRKHVWDGSGDLGAMEKPGIFMGTNQPKLVISWHLFMVIFYRISPRKYGDSMGFHVGFNAGWWLRIRQPTQTITLDINSQQHMARVPKIRDEANAKRGQDQWLTEL